MIGRHPLKQPVGELHYNQYKTFKTTKAKTTKADKTKAKAERIKNHKAQNLPKKNAQEVNKKRFSLKNRRDTIDKWQAFLSVKEPTACFVTPKRPVPNMVPEKYYKVLHVDVQKLDEMELRILHRETELNKGKAVQSEPAMVLDKDDEEVIDAKHEKKSREQESFTIVWILIGGNDKLECQWVNADDLYFV